MIATGIWFGSVVDHHPKKSVLQGSAVVSFVLYGLSLVLYVLSPPAAFARSRPALTAAMQRRYWGTVKLVVLFVEMPRAVSSSIRSTRWRAKDWVVSHQQVTVQTRPQ